MQHDEKRELVQAFRDCVAEFPTGKGSRNCVLLPRAACLAVKMGMGESEFTQTIRDVAPDMAAMDIRRTYRTATKKVQTSTTTTGWNGWKGTGGMGPGGIKKPQPKTYPKYVRHLINAGRDVSTVEGLQALSPEPIAANRFVQVLQHMATIFPDERAIAYIFRNDPPTPGVLGRTIMPVWEWLKATNPHQPEDVGELIVPNPFTGKEGQTADGKQSLIAQSCLADFSHVVIEFDEMPIEDQCRFWAGFIRESKLPLVCLVHSGGKSIHGCVRVGCHTLEAWQQKRDQLASLFAADPDKRFRVDTQAMRPRTGMRLAGAIRKSTGQLQRLVWRCRWDDVQRWAGEANTETVTGI